VCVIVRGFLIAPSEQLYNDRMEEERSYSDGKSMAL